MQRDGSSAWRWLYRRNEERDIKTEPIAYPRLENPVAGFFTAVYGWMTVALAVAALVAWGTSHSKGLVDAIVVNPGALWAMVLAQLALGLVLSTQTSIFRSKAAVALFLGYAALDGVTLTLLVIGCTGSSFTGTFAIAAGLFGVLTSYGLLTRRYLSGFARGCTIVLFGAISAGIIELFWNSSPIQSGISALVMVVLAALTGWDSQRLEQMALGEDARFTPGAHPVTGALTLYLDLINLCVSLPRFLGRPRRY